MPSSNILVTGAWKLLLLIFFSMNNSSGDYLVPFLPLKHISKNPMLLMHSIGFYETQYMSIYFTEKQNRKTKCSTVIIIWKNIGNFIIAMVSSTLFIVFKRVSIFSWSLSQWIDRICFHGRICSGRKTWSALDLFITTTSFTWCHWWIFPRLFRKRLLKKCGEKCHFCFSIRLYNRKKGMKRKVSTFSQNYILN